MSLVQDFFAILGDLKFGECLEILRKIRSQSSKLKKWLGHLVMCEKDYYRARFGTDKNDSLQQRYSFLQGKVFEMTKNAPFETTGSNDDIRTKRTRMEKYNDQYGIMITRQMWTSLQNFVSTRESLCTLYEMISKSKPPHHYDYFCRETVEIQKNSKITHVFLKRIQENMTCESYIDKLRYTECMYAFWSVRESLRSWRDLHRNIGKDEEDEDDSMEESNQPFQFSSPARFTVGNTDASKKPSSSGPAQPSPSQGPPSNVGGYEPQWDKKTTSFRIRAQDSISTIRRLFGFGSRGGEKQPPNPFKSPPRQPRPTKTLTPQQQSSMGKKKIKLSKRPSSTGRPQKPKLNDEQQQAQQPTSLLETFDLYKWMKILHGYTFSKFSFFFHDILSRPLVNTSSSSTNEKNHTEEFEKTYSEVGINYVERIRQFCQGGLNSVGSASGGNNKSVGKIDYAFLIYKGTRNYGTLTLDPKAGYSIDLNLNLNKCVENTFQGIKSYPCLFFYNFAEERETKDADDEGEDDSEEEEDEGELGDDNKRRKNKKKKEKKKKNNDDDDKNEKEEEKETGSNSTVIKIHWANILQYLWGDDAKMSQERRPLFYFDDRVGIGYYYMKVGEDVYFVFLNRGEEKKNQVRRKRVLDFMSSMNVFLQNLKLFEFLKARAPEN